MFPHNLSKKYATINSQTATALTHHLCLFVLGCSSYSRIGERSGKIAPLIPSKNGLFFIAHLSVD